MYREIKEQWPQDDMRLFVLETIEYLLCNPLSTVEEAMELCLEERLEIALSDQSIATFLKYSKKIDLFVRMYFRAKAVRIIAETGVPVTIIGDGWDE